MTPDQERHARSKALFVELCQLAPERRAEFLDRVCAGDDELRSELESLLEHHLQEGDPAAEDLRATKVAGGRARRGGESDQRLRRDMAFHIGQVINDRYRIVSELGRGGMGEVVEAHDLVLDQRVALKLLVEATPERREQLINEVRLARLVTHANVCRVFDVGQHGDEVFLSMEAVDGEDLDSLLKRAGRLPGERVLEIARQLGAGLAAAHAKNVLHRDLKPANVLVDSHGQVKITDFGIAESGDDPGHGKLARGGTPGFMAPELFEGGGATQRSDLYSLGLVLYEIATGRAAFEAGSIADYVRLHREVTPPQPSSLGADLHPDLEAVIMRCLAKDPQDRPGSALEVIAALPGVDPLQVALDIGATPPPELVASVRGEEGWGPGPAIGCFVATLVLLLAALALSDRANGFGGAGLELPPQVLAHQAVLMLDDLGLDPGDGFEAMGFLQDVEAAELGLVDRSVLFWYRSAHEPLLPLNMADLLYLSPSADPDDPPLDVEGMVRIALDTRGRLVMLEVVPAVDRPPQDARQRPDWSRLLRHAGLDGAGLEPAEPRLTPPVFADTTAAWRGKLPGHSEVPIHVDAAALGDRPVYFELQLLAGDDEADGNEPASMRRLDLQNTLLDIVFVVLAVAAVPMARRNLRRGRSDPRGARRLAVLVGSVWFVSWALQADHTLQPSAEVTLLSAATAVALLQGGLVWLYYLALEPWVRRLWPHTLVSWSRVLRATFRDAMVGRSLLLGSLLGTLWAVCVMLDRLAPTVLGLQPPPFPVDSLQLSAALSGRDLVATLFDLQVSAVYDGLYSLLLLLVLRLALRRWWPAVIGLVVITAVFETLSGASPWVSWLTLGVGVAATGAIALVRFGLLTLVCGFFVLAVLESYPLTSTMSAWYADSGLFAVAVAACVAGAGLWLMRSRPR